MNCKYCDTLSFCLYGSSFVSLSTYSNIGPFYPGVAEKRGVSEFTVGLILIGFPLGSLIFSVFVDRIVFLLGRKQTLVLGCFLEGVFIILFGFLYLIDGKVPFIVISFILRFCQGFANCFIFASLIAIITAVYPDDYAKRIGVNEFVIGLGLMLGPMIGSVFFSLGHQIFGEE